MSMEDAAQVVELLEWERNNLGREDKPVRFEPDEPGYGPAECEECGDEMPAERRAWGYRICVSCKTLEEATVARSRR